jgi:hypothetical protein
VPYFTKRYAKGIGRLTGVEPEFFPEVRVGQDIKLNSRAGNAAQSPSPGAMPASVDHPDFLNWFPQMPGWQDCQYVAAVVSFQAVGAFGGRGKMQSPVMVIKPGIGVIDHTPDGVLESSAWDMDTAAQFSDFAKEQGKGQNEEVVPGVLKL